MHLQGSREALENPLNSMETPAKKDPLYDSAAEVKEQVKEVSCACKIFIRKMKPMGNPPTLLIGM